MAINGITRRTPPLGVRAVTQQPAVSVATQRMQKAAARACDAHRRTQTIAEGVREELEETTAPHGIPVTELHEEDSLVTVVKDALAANASK